MGENKGEASPIRPPGPSIGGSSRLFIDGPAVRVEGALPTDDLPSEEDLERSGNGGFDIIIKIKARVHREFFLVRFFVS